MSGQGASIKHDAQFCALVFTYMASGGVGAEGKRSFNALVQHIDSRPRSEDSRAKPDFFKGAPVKVRNENGHIYSAVVTRSETRWSADQKPYIYYKVRAEGETTDNVIVASMILTKPALASTTPPKADNE